MFKLKSASNLST